MFNIFRIAKHSTRLLLSPTMRLSQVTTHLSNSKRYLSLRQYVLAELELRRAETMSPTPDEQQELDMIRAEMELEKPEPDFGKAI